MIFRKSKGNQKFIGYTLRQWTLLFTIIFCIFTAIFVTLSILGLLKSEYGWKLIKADITEEENKSGPHVLSNHNEITSNEKKLCDSIQSELIKTCVFYLCSWIGILNLITVLCLLYGVITRNHVYMLPWIIISLVTFGIALFTVVAMRYDSTSNMKSMNLFTGLGSTAIFGLMWNTIVTYFKTLMKSESKKNTIATIIKAYGGYTHTLKPVAENNK